MCVCIYIYTHTTSTTARVEGRREAISMREAPCVHPLLRVSAWSAWFSLERWVLVERDQAPGPCQSPSTQAPEPDALV